MDGETFGARLRFWRETRELSQRGLAALAHYSKSQISDLERGIRMPRSDVAAQLDTLLEADGELHALAESSHIRDSDADVVDAGSYTELAVSLLAAGGDVEMMDRRTFVLGLSGATSLGAVAPGLALEATRHGLTLGLAEERATAAVDEWREIVWEYGQSYLATPPSELLESLVVDTLGLQVALGREARHANLKELQQAGAMLAALTAMTIANVGDVRQARRWWRSARVLAEQSGHVATICWVRGREAIRGLYEGRPAGVILKMVEQAQGFVAEAVPADLPELLSAKAQASALAGRRSEAEAALYEVRAIYDGLPTEVLGNRDSIYGWPENRLRFTESYVYSYLGESAKAGQAQDRAVAVYSGSYRRGPAQIELQRALCMVADGDVTGGAQHAASALQSLPTKDQIRPVVALAREVLGAVPAPEQTRPAVSEFRECLSLTTGA